jgi:hypothetical protein
MHAHAPSPHVPKPPELKPLEAKPLEVGPFEPKPAEPLVKPLADTVTPIFGSFGRRSAQELERAKHDLELRTATRPVAALIADEDDHAAEQCVACPGPLPEDSAKTYHVNLRLKRQRFIKLKLSAALLRRPVQDVVAEALDQWFDKLPTDVLGDCACMRARD